MSAETRNAASDPDECRCVCGNLVAKVVAGGVELKCRRCKRKLIVAVPADRLPRSGTSLRVVAAREAG